MSEPGAPLAEAADTISKVADTVFKKCLKDPETGEFPEGYEAAEDQDQPINWEGLAAIIVFYLAVLVVGLWAGFKNRKKSTDSEQVMVAGRDIGLGVGVLTMGATWVGGGFINGSAQETYKVDGGLIWTQAPFGYSIAHIVAGTYYAQKMRKAKYVTMIDPFTQKYGGWGALQALPAAMSEIFWSASILGALGSTLQVILNLDEKLSIISSAVIALGYTLFGGLISVAYTDVIQIFFIVFGLFLALPFAVTHEAVADLYHNVLDGDNAANATLGVNWYGEVKPWDWGLWMDYAFLLVCGGIPWQCYYQRVLSSKTAARAQLLSYGGAAIALIMTAPSVLFGAIAKNTNWEAVGYGCAPVGADSKLVLPLALQYLTPRAVAFFGLGAVSAAVMSSTDSSMLSASTMIARNFYQKVIRPNCSEREVIWALWVCICINCGIATALAITYRSIYDLFVLCGDFMFVIVFPQLTLVLWWELANTYGSVFSFFISLLLRLLCGDKVLGLPAVIVFGYIYGPEGSCPIEDDPLTLDVDESDALNPCKGLMPFRLFVTIIGALLHVIVSYSAYYLFTNRKLDLSFDFFGAFKEEGRREDGRPSKVVLASDRHLKDETEMDETEMDERKKKKTEMISIPRAKVSMDGGLSSYENNGYKS